MSGAGRVRGWTLVVHPPSGTPVQLLVVERDGLVFAIPAAERTRWASLVLDDGEAVLEWPDGRRERRSARLVTDRDLIERVREAFREAHGGEKWTRYFERRSRIVQFGPWETRAAGYPKDRLQAEFDAVASRYAGAVAENPFAARLRRRSLSHLLPLFEGRDPILELGCGSGIETVELLCAGHRVTAVDISPQMLYEVQKKARHLGLEGRLTTWQGRITQLGELVTAAGPASFAGAFSTFGALNLEADLDPVRRALALALDRGSPFFAGVLNRHAFAPVAYALASRRPREALNRLKYPIPAEGSAFPVAVFPTTRRRFAELFRPEFQLELAEGASVLAPPDDVPRLRREMRASALGTLGRWDERLCRTRVGTELAEWQFLTFRRVGPARGV